MSDRSLCPQCFCWTLTQCALFGVEVGHVSAGCSSFDLKLHPSVHPYGFFCQPSVWFCAELVSNTKCCRTTRSVGLPERQLSGILFFIVMHEECEPYSSKRCVLYWLKWGQIFKGVFECRTSTTNATSLKTAILFCGGYKFLGLLSFDMLKDWCFYPCGHFAALKIMLIGTSWKVEAQL